MAIRKQGLSVRAWGVDGLTEIRECSEEDALNFVRLYAHMKGTSVHEAWQILLGKKSGKPN